MPSVKLVKSDASIAAAVRLPALAESPVIEEKKIELAKVVTAVNPLHQEHLLPLKCLQGRKKPLLNDDPLVVVDQAMLSIAVIAATAIRLQDLMERVELLLVNVAPRSRFPAR